MIRSLSQLTDATSAIAAGPELGLAKGVLATSLSNDHFLITPATAVSGGGAISILAPIATTTHTVTSAPISAAVAVPETVIKAVLAVYNVRDFGARGDGVTDDTKAIQAAINAAHNAGGGSVYVPSGLYILKGNTLMNSSGCLRLTDNVTIYGDGMGQTTLKVADGWSGTITGIIRTPFGVQTHDVGIHDLTLDGNRDHTGGKIDGFFSGVAPGSPGQATNILIDHVEIMNCEGYGFDPHEQTVNITISNSSSHGNGLDGYALDYLINSKLINDVAYDNDRHGFNVVTSTHDLTITNAVAHDNGGAGLTVQRGSEDITWPTRITVDGGQFYDNTKGGILLQMADHVTIRNATIHDNDSYGIRLYGATNTLIENNTIANDSDAGDKKYAEIQIQAYDDTGGDSGNYYTSHDNLVRNNTMYETQSVGAKNGINESADGSDYTTVYGNTITNMHGTAIVLTGAHSISEATPPTPGTTYNGTDSGDNYTGTSADDTINGLKGNDSLNGAGGNDVIDGGTGNDILTGGDGDDRLLGNSNNDNLSGGNGNDYLDGSSGNDSLAGGANDDILHGGTGLDILYGNDGNDLMFGEDDIDTLDGGAGADNIEGGKGDDILLGGTGDDWIKGQSGLDKITGGAGNDTLTGSTEFDTFLFAVGSGNDTITDMRHGTDVISVTSAMVGGSMATLLADISYSSGNALIDFHNGDTILLTGVTAGSLTSSDFLIN